MIKTCLLGFIAIMLTGCLNDSKKSSNYHDQIQISANEIEQKQSKLAELQSKKEQEIQRQKELEAERLRLVKEQQRENEIDLTAKSLIRKEIYNACQVKQINCTEIDVYYINYLGKQTNTDRYVVDFELILTTKEDVWVTQKDKFQGQLYYDFFDDDTYLNDLDMQHIGKESEPGAGTMVGLAAGALVLDWIINGDK